jgi:magnesium transporter
MLDMGLEPTTEQIALFVGSGFLISFQERAGDCLEPVRERLRHGHGRLRAEGADYLAYALIDGVIDAYFPMLEHYGEEVDALEDAVVAAPRSDQAARLYRVKRDLIMLRRAVWPTRDLLNAMLRDENPLLTSHTRLFLRDAYDHTVQLMDLVETYREITTGLLDVYLSSQSARMNEIMKFLTIIATIFIPLGFLASLWGMNFDRASPWNLPELGWRFGYPAAIAVMIAVGAGLLVYFRRKGWLNSGADRVDDSNRRKGEGAPRG